jgi:sec-independent protein translocase protein TatA
MAIRMRNLRADTSGILEGLDLIIIIIVIAALFLLGPKKLPEMFRSVGRALGEFRRGKMEIEQEIRSQFSDGIQPVATHDRLAGVATSLGVDSSAKTDAQIKIAIARALDKAPDAQLRTAAQNLGVNLLGGDLEGLKQEILKALAL